MAQVHAGFPTPGIIVLGMITVLFFNPQIVIHPALL